LALSTNREIPFPAELVLKRVLSEWQSRQSLFFKAAAARPARGAQARNNAGNRVKILFPISLPASDETGKSLYVTWRLLCIFWRSAYGISCPSGTRPGSKKVFINSPSPQTVKPGNFLNHLCSDTPGSTREEHELFVRDISLTHPRQEMNEQGLRKIVAPNLRHEVCRRRTPARSLPEAGRPLRNLWLPSFALPVGRVHPDLNGDFQRFFGQIQSHDSARRWAIVLSLR
jgi:hypothetical protein